MVYYHSVATFPDDLDLSRVNARFVRTASILHLPFRLRVGKLLRVRVGKRFEVVFRNQMDIAHGTPAEDIVKMTWVGKSLLPWTEFFTDAMVIDSKPQVDDERAKRIADFAQQESNQIVPEYNQRPFDGLSALNDAIVAYHSATQEFVGGHVVHRLTLMDFFEDLRDVYCILSPPIHRLADDEIVEMLDRRPTPEVRSLGRQFGLDLADLAPDQVANIEKCVQLHQRHIFYQFALDAKARMAEQDHISGILFAVVALEGAHATVLQMCLEKKLVSVIADPRERAKQVEQKANKLLMDVGFSEMVEVTSMLLLNDADRPNLEDVKACQFGITIRNDIMHALEKGGKYRLRSRTPRQISQAYSSILKLYQHFVNIIEKAQLQDASNRS